MWVEGHDVQNKRETGCPYKAMIRLDDALEKPKDISDQ